MKQTTLRRLERLEKVDPDAHPLVWFRIKNADGSIKPSEPPAGWDKAPDHLRRVIVFNVIPAPEV
jgi:hypothetical protein